MIERLVYYNMTHNGLSDVAAPNPTETRNTKGYLAMIPKFLKCQKEFYPTPLSTLQKLTIEILRPNGELVSTAPDTYDIAGIIGADPGGNGGGFPFTVNLSSSIYDVSNGTDPYNFYIVTNKYFSRFEVSAGDRIQISGYTYTDAAFNDATNGPALRDFCNWINRPEGHIVLNIGYTDSNVSLVDGVNNVGYANVIIIQARYQNPFNRFNCATAI